MQIARLHSDAMKSNVVHSCQLRGFLLRISRWGRWLVEGSGNLSDALGFNVFLSTRNTLTYRKSNRATTLVHLL